MGLAFIPLYIKYLGIESYGLIGVFALLQAWLGLLDMGMTPTLSREMSRFTAGTHSAQSIRDLLRSIEIIAAGVAFLIATGIWSFSDWLASDWLQAERLPVAEVAQAFTVMGLVTALRFIEGIYRSSIVGLQRQVFFNVAASTMATLRGLGSVVVLAWVSPTIEAFFFWQGAISILAVGVLAYATYHALPKAEHGGRFSPGALRRVGRYAGGMVSITFLALLLTQVDKILLSKLLALGDFGYYSLAAVVASSLYMVVGPICQAWFPRLSELHARNDHEGLVEAYHHGAQLVTVFMGSAGVVMIVFAETILYLWTQDFALASRSANLVRLLALGNLLNGLMWIPYQAQLAHGWTGLGIRINAVSVLLIVPAIFWATPRYGAEGAAWVWVCLNAGYVLVGIHFMYRKILTQEKKRWYLNDTLFPLSCATIVTFIVHSIAPSTTHPITQIIVLTIATSLSLMAAMTTTPILRRKFLTILKIFLLRRAL